MAISSQRTHRPAPVVVHLSGRPRGTTQQLAGDRLRIGAAVDAEIRVSPEPSVEPYHATLSRTGDGGWELLTEPDSPVWMNGRPARRQPLTAGDVLEIGRDGPLLRYRVYPPGTRPSKSGDVITHQISSLSAKMRSA